MEEYKVSGAIIQLKAYGASDVLLTSIKGTPMPNNIRASINFWFIDNNDGLATIYDIEKS